MVLIDESEEDLLPGWQPGLSIEPALLDGFDVLRFFHRPCETFFIGAREQKDLADLTKVHPDGVIDAFLFFKGGSPRLLDLVVLDVFLFRSVGPRVGRSSAVARAIEHRNGIREAREYVGDAIFRSFRQYVSPVPGVIAVERGGHVFERLTALHYTSPSGTLNSTLLLEYSLMNLQPGFHVVNEGRSGIGLFFGGDVFRSAALPRRTCALGDLLSISRRRVGH